MATEYINFSTTRAQGRWDRRTFLNKWWDIYTGDIRWAPPYYPTLRREIEPAKNDHLARMQPLFAYIEAYPTRRQPAEELGTLMRSPFGPPTTSLMNKPLATAAILMDPRRDDGTGYLAMLHCENSVEALERLLWDLVEDLRPRGCRRLIGPVGLSPHLLAGALQDRWNQFPPIYTPYNPPYLPEVLDNVLRPLENVSRLYRLSVPESPATAPGPAEIIPFDPLQLTDDLLPLFQHACTAQSTVEYPPPDRPEAQFLLRRLRPWPLAGWLARVDGDPVGFILVQSDHAPALHRAKGGRNPLWRLWLRVWTARRPTQVGRLLFGTVTPTARRQGIGTQLLSQAFQHGHTCGWTTLFVGPIPAHNTAAHRFLLQHDGQPAQTYLLYEWHV